MSIRVPNDVVLKQSRVGGGGKKAVESTPLVGRWAKKGVPIHGDR